MLLQIFSLQSGFLISQLPVRYLGVPLVPRRFIKKVTQLCHSFFWKVNYSPVKVLVSVGISSVIPNLKVLGLKNLKEWSKPCILKNTWLILIKSGSLWVAWTSAYILEGRSELWLGQLSVRGILNFMSGLFASAIRGETNEGLTGKNLFGSLLKFPKALPHCLDDCF